MGEVGIFDRANADPRTIELGQPSVASGRAALDNFSTALELAREGQVDAVCFTPFNKQALRMAGNRHEDELRFAAEALEWPGLVSEFNILGQLWNSTLVTAGGVALILIVSTTGGYAFSKLTFKGSGLVFLAILSGMMIPVQSIIIPVYVNIVNVARFSTDVLGTHLTINQFFGVTLSNPSMAATAPATLGNPTQVVQILNDEKPSLTATNVSGPEGSVLQFGATLVQRYYQPVVVSYQTANGAAVAPGDYTAASGSITFPAGTNGTQTVGVTTKFDFTTEVAEKFSMIWSSGSIKASPVTKTGTIKGNKT